MPKKNAQPIVPFVYDAVEVFDTRGYPLMHMPLAAIMRQRLHFRLVLLALCDKTGRLFLHKRQQSPLGHAGMWDIFVTPVLPAEAPHDTALRLFTETVDIPAPAIFPLVAEGLVTPESHIARTLFRVELPTGILPISKEHDDLLRVDADELAGLVTQIPELLTPELVWAASTKELCATL